MGAQGTAVVDFGIFVSGSTQAQVMVTGQTAILTSNLCEAWIRPQDPTSDHSVDEHIIEKLKVTAGSIVAGSGFTIYVECENSISYGQWSIAWVWN